MGLLDKYRKNAGSSLKDKIIESKKGNYKEDETLYYPVRDDNKRASVVIRFLPQKDSEALPFVQFKRHGFKGDDGRWVIEDVCPASFEGGKCPLCEIQRALWATGQEKYQDLYRRRKAATQYIANILVIKDPQSPEKEGKVFKFKFGNEIYNKIIGALQPEFEDQPSINAFDIMEGADFNLKVMIDPKKKMTTYSASSFAAPTPLCGGDETEMENVLSQLYDLNAEYNLARCHSYDEIKAKAISAYAVSFPEWASGEDHKISRFANTVVDKPKREVAKPSFDDEPVKPSESGDDLDEFKKMIEEDDEVPF